MSETQKNHAETSDPFEPFRTVRDKYLDAMAKSMVETVNSESYAQASGAMLEGYLTATAPLRDAMDKSMKQALEQLSLPSRQDVASLAERFTHVEMRLDDMDAKLDRIVQALRSEGPGAAPRAEPAADDIAEEEDKHRSGEASVPGARGRFVHKKGTARKRS